MFYLLITCYAVAFFTLAFKNFRFVVGLFIISLPTYLIRFNIGPLPSTLLELSFGILFLVWLIKYARADWPTITYHISRNKLLLISCCLFLIASIASIFVSDMWYISLGQWRAYFLEPMILFLMLVGRTGRQTSPNLSLERRGSDVSTTDLIWFLTLSTISVSLFGIIQRFTGWHIGNVDLTALQTGRVTSFFLSPNAVGLYLGPVFPLMTIQLFNKPVFGGPKYPIFKYLFNIFLASLSLITLFLSRSVGAWVGVGAGMLLFGWLLGYKKIVGGIAIVCVLLSLAPPVQHLLAAKNQSGENRFTLWSYSWTFLSQSPKNFILGTGIRQFFRKVQKPFYNVKELERLIYPHNIFLNFWTEIGLLGALSFTFITYLLFLISFKVYKNTDKLLGAALLAVLITILIHGLIDVPYFKNDLAMLWWIMTALIITANKKTAL